MRRKTDQPRNDTSRNWSGPAHSGSIQRGTRIEEKKGKSLSGYRFSLPISSQNSPAYTHYAAGFPSVGEQQEGVSHPLSDSTPNHVALPLNLNHSAHQPSRKLLLQQRCQQSILPHTMQRP